VGEPNALGAVVVRQALRVVDAGKVVTFVANRTVPYSHNEQPARFSRVPFARATAPSSVLRWSGPRNRNACSFDPEA